MSDSLLKSMGKAPPSPKFIRHRTPKALARAFADGIEKNGGNELADAIRANPEFVENIWLNGFWAFAEPKTATICFWLGDVSREQALFLFAHEIGHIADEHAKRMRRGRVNHELRADLYGWVTEEAMRAVSRAFPAPSPERQKKAGCD